MLNTILVTSANIFSISPQAVNSHIKRLENEDWLASSGIGKGKRYFLGDLRKYHSYFPFTGDLAEDQIWRSHYSFVFEDLPENTGTLVYMSIQREADRNLQDVFDRFTAGPDEFQFNKTVIPVRLAQYENEKLVSRSQAKRMLTRIERFQNVIFDFEGVTVIGQAFADEIFGVYAFAHPDITLVPAKMEGNVFKMVSKATSALEAQLKKQV